MRVGYEVHPHRRENVQDINMSSEPLKMAPLADFNEFNLNKPIIDGILAAGFKNPSPIQTQSIPVILGGSDLVGQAQTGSGKTAAFVIPALQQLQYNRAVEILVLVPTRELCKQVVLEFERLGNFTKIIAKHCTKVVAVESSQVSLKSLIKENISNLKVIDADIFQNKNWKKIENHSQGASVLILDPPRAGFKEIDLFVQSFKSIKEMIYISCDLSSFLRDMSRLSKLGWGVDECQPLDQFPHTPHIELLVFIKKQS